jgi:hypothetical protein
MRQQTKVSKNNEPLKTIKNENKNTALITSAFNGIGLELAKIHASKGGDLELQNVIRKHSQTPKNKIYFSIHFQ